MSVHPQLHDPAQPPPAPGRPAAAPSASPLPQGGVEGAPGGHGKNAFTSERPLGVAPAPEGGVAIGGQPNLPEEHATIGDKIMGKVEKVIGKYTNDANLHEKGELRETGGKAAVQGCARAAHD